VRILSRGRRSKHEYKARHTHSAATSALAPFVPARPTGITVELNFPSPIVRRNIFLLLGSVVVALALGELAVRVAAAVMHREPIVISDPRAGWAGRPDLKNTKVIYRGGAFTLSTDAAGDRISYPIGQSPPVGVPDLLVVGDSFAEGISVNDDQTFPWMLARRTPYRVVNLGVVGYGTCQELVKLEEYLENHPQTTIQHIVVLVFDNDFIDVQRDLEPFLGRHTPRFQVVNQALVRPRYRLPVVDRLMDMSRLFWLVRSKVALLTAHDSPAPEQGVELVLACLGEMRRLAETRGARLHIFAHHHLRNSPMFPDSIWQRFLDLSGAIDMTSRLRASNGPDPIGTDGAHWSPAGNELVTEIVAKSLTAYGRMLPERKVTVGPVSSEASSRRGRPRAIAMLLTKTRRTARFAPLRELASFIAGRQCV
jgi:hypothetical protein